MKTNSIEPVDAAASVWDDKANDWDLSINRYKEVVYEEVSYTEPSTIIKDIKQLDMERASSLTLLEELLKNWNKWMH